MEEEKKKILLKRKKDEVVVKLPGESVRVVQGRKPKPEAIQIQLAQFQWTVYRAQVSKSQMLKLSGVYDDNDEDAKKYWIGCDSCVRWYHYYCVDLGGIPGGVLVVPCLLKRVTV